MDHRMMARNTSSPRCTIIAGCRRWKTCRPSRWELINPAARSSPRWRETADLVELVRIASSVVVIDSPIRWRHSSH